MAAALEARLLEASSRPSRPAGASCQVRDRGPHHLDGKQPGRFARRRVGRPMEGALAGTRKSEGKSEELHRELTTARNPGDEALAAARPFEARADRGDRLRDTAFSPNHGRVQRRQYGDPTASRGASNAIAWTPPDPSGETRSHSSQAHTVTLSRVVSLTSMELALFNC